MNWIRIAVDIHDDPAIARMAEMCHVRISEMVGCIVGVLSCLPSQSRGGQIGHVPDRLLEQWAHWEGKRLVFARAFRAELCHADGLVRGWEKHNGAAIREADRQRAKSEQYRGKQRDYGVGEPRDEPRDEPGTVPRDEPGTVPGTSRANGTGRDETTVLSRMDGGVVTGHPATETAWTRCAPVIAPAGHAALRALLSTVPDPDGWAILIHAQASGLNGARGQAASRSRLASALTDFVAKGKHLERPPSPRLFRRFVERAKPGAEARGYPTPEERQAIELAQIRESNDTKRVQGQATYPEPPWAASIDAMYPDGRTRPDLRLTGAHP